MLRRLRLVDFKSFADEAVELAPLTLLVGANASGKSNCLDALRFLRETVADQGIGEILDGEQRPGAGPNAWQGLRGGSKEASRIGAESFLIESTWELPEWPEEEVSFMHRIRCRTVPRPTWEEEGIYTDDARPLLVARAIAQGEGGTRRIDWTSPTGSVETTNGHDYSILHRGRLPSPWAEIRGERDPKERFAHPFLAAHAPKLDAGQGRKWAMRDLGVRWKGLLDVCPEIAELKARIAAEIGRRA